MPVRLRIALLFTLMVFAILTLVCSSVYYFSHTNRLKNMHRLLINRANTTARLLSQSDVVYHQLLQKIDASTSSSLEKKSIQAYDYSNTRIYTYTDNKDDTISVSRALLHEARIKQTFFFRAKEREAVAYFYTLNDKRLVIIVAAYDAEGWQKLSQLQTILLSSFIAGLFISLGFGYFFSKRLLYPVRKIADEVNEISVQNLTRRINSGKANDEWHYLAGTLNELLNRLQESFEIQRRFISNASHELSTPLTSISSQLEVSLQRDRDAGDYRSVMQSVYQDVQHMSQLTQTLLEFAKASGTTGGLEIDLVRIDEVLLRLPAEMIKLDKEYSVKLAFDALPEEEEKLLVFGNEELLFIAMKNIVANACKYSPDHVAEVRLTIGGNESIVEIRDRGIGIPENEIENIFQPFYRIEENRHIKGFGLGLPLANRIIKLHKGFIRVESENNAGTVFTIVLPITFLR